MSQVSETVCSNCHSVMPAELRFCRNCGFRLTNGAGSMPIAETAPPVKRKRRLSGMAWIFIGLLAFFVCAAAFTAIVSPIRKSAEVGFHIPVVKSYIGVNEFNDSPRGVTFKNVSAPGGPADQAGLVGGDIITKVDGQPVEKEDQIDEIMTRTPIGKTIEIEYMRDGEKKTTKLTTISADENRRLTREFDRNREKGQFGFDDDETDVVEIPGTNLRGVKLNSILRSRPADLAGIKQGDVVTEYDGVPIRTPEEFLMRVRRSQPYTTVKVVVMRPGEGDQFEKLEIPVKLGRQ
jgi:S1-C subfamily serine protease